MTLPESHPPPCDRREVACAAALLALLVAAFLWRPIANFGTSHFSTAELLNELPLTRAAPAHWVRDRLSSDPVVEFLPWISFARSELAHGRVPLWNPYNACGAPLVGNHQSAVFSPFTLPFYFVSTKVALLASAFAKLWLAGLFTYLFLRSLRITPLAAFGGAVAFAFCGHNALLLHWPHSGVIVWLPASLACVERIVSALEDPRGRSTLAWYAALAVVLALEVYSGHPETLGLGVATLALWSAVRLLWMSASVGTARCARVALQLVATGVLAFGLAAPQLFPFIEYLTHSFTLHFRSKGRAAAVDASTWPRHFFPNFLGTNLSGKELVEGLPPPTTTSPPSATPARSRWCSRPSRSRRRCATDVGSAFAAIAVLAPIWSARSVRDRERFRWRAMVRCAAALCRASAVAIRRRVPRSAGARRAAARGKTSIAYERSRWPRSASRPSRGSSPLRCRCRASTWRPLTRAPALSPRSASTSSSSR
jgi:hypothetical protein